MSKTKWEAVGRAVKRLLALPLLTLAVLAALLTSDAQDPPQASANHSTEIEIWSSDFKVFTLEENFTVGCWNLLAGQECSPETPGANDALDNPTFTIGSTTYSFLRIEFYSILPHTFRIEIDQPISKRQRDSWTLHFDATKESSGNKVDLEFSLAEASTGIKGNNTTFNWPYDGSVSAENTIDASFRITEKVYHAGELDPGFGNAGKITGALQARDSQINDIAIQEDGKIVAAGYVENGTTSSPNKDFALARYLPNGALDPSFGNGGKVITAFGTGDDLANAVAIQSDGKIVAAGQARAIKDTTNDNADLAIARYMPNGELDTNFGTSGKKAFGRGPTEIGHAVAIQSDGKIVVAGRIANDMAIWRYLADGSKLDTGAFNKDETPSNPGDNLPRGPGFLTVSWGTNPSDRHEEARAMHLHKDGALAGKIVVAGRSQWEFAIVRIKTDGTLDSTFDSNGRTKYAVSNANGAIAEAFSLMANQSSSRYYVGGYAHSASESGYVVSRHKATNGVLECWNPDNTSCDVDSSDSHEKVNKLDLNGLDQATAMVESHLEDVIVAGFGATGGVDNFELASFFNDQRGLSLFGDNGRKKTDVAGRDDRLFALEILPDDSYVGAGYASLPAPGDSSSSIKHFSLAKYTDRFRLDVGFGVGGIVTTPFGVGTNRIEDIEVLDNNKILAVGSVGEGKAATFHPEADVAVFRFNANGTLDTTFGTGGIVRLDRDSNEDRGHALLVKSDGKILVAGTSRNSVDGWSGLAVVRLNADGTIDTNFGDSGWASVSILGSSKETANAIAEDSAGRIILAGPASTGNDLSSFGIGVLKANGTKDASFGDETDDAGDKRFLFNPITEEGHPNKGAPLGMDVAEAVAVDSNDRIVVAGWTEYNSDGDTRVALARVTSAGSLDSSFGTGGKVQSGFGTDFAKANAMAFDGDKIMIAGRMGTKEDGNFLLARYTANGTLDTTFNDTGYIEIDIGSKSNEVHALKRTSAGEWLLVGSSGVGDDAGDLAIVRVRSNATIDGHFGPSRTGANTTKLSNENEAGLAVDLDSNGNIVVGGTVFVDKGSSSIVPRDYFALARYFGRVAESADTRLNSLAFVPHKDGADGTAKTIRSSNPSSPFAYSASLPAGNTHFKLKPTAAQSGVTISITSQGGSSQTVTSGAKSSAIPIAASNSETATILVTSSDGNTMQTYTVKVTRPADPPASNMMPTATATPSTMPNTATTQAPPPPPPNLNSDGGGGGAPANDSPTFAESSLARMVQENSAAGSLVGEPITATDADGDSITYALEGDSAGLFEIDPRTGQITVAEGAELDFESDLTEFTLTVTATDEDGSGQSARAEITIAVADVELPDATAQYDINFNEQIELQELLAALRDFVEGKLTLPQIIAIILHFLSG